MRSFGDMRYEDISLSKTSKTSEFLKESLRNERPEEKRVNSGMRTAKEMMILRVLEQRGVKGVPRVIESQSGYVADKGHLFTSAKLEKIEGENWGEHVFKDEKELVTATIKVIKILNEVYKNGFIQNDIKPPNLMIKPNGQGVALDFNNAEKLVDGKAWSGTGTDGFSAPEKYQVTKKDGTVTKGQCDVRSDIYSLAMVLADKMKIYLEPLKENLIALEFRRQFFSREMFLAKTNGKISEKMYSFIMINTEDNPDYRFQNYEDCLKALEMVADSTVSNDDLLDFYAQTRTV